MVDSKKEKERKLVTGSKLAGADYYDDDDVVEGAVTDGATAGRSNNNAPKTTAGKTLEMESALMATLPTDGASPSLSAAFVNYFAPFLSTPLQALERLWRPRGEGRRRRAREEQLRRDQNPPSTPST